MPDLLSTDNGMHHPVLLLEKGAGLSSDTHPLLLPPMPNTIFRLLVV